MLNSTSPVVSVIVPTHNRCDSLLKLLDSLFNQSLDQSKYEIIVVCDGATDGSARKVKELCGYHRNLQCIEQRQAGPAAARNAGAKIAKASILAFTDDDCLATNSWLAEIIGPFQRSTIVAVEGKTSTIVSELTPLTHQVESEGTSNAMPTCNAACRREAFENVAGFSVDFPYPHNEDADLAWRLEKTGFIDYQENAVIIHPPRAEGFQKKVRWVRYLESEFLLYSRNPLSYRKYRYPSPWITIYWKVFLINQLGSAKSSARYLVKTFQPRFFINSLGIVIARWFLLVALFPRFYRVAHRLKIDGQFSKK